MRKKFMQLPINISKNAEKARDMFCKAVMKDFGINPAEKFGHGHIDFEDSQIDEIAE